MRPITKALPRLLSVSLAMFAVLQLGAQTVPTSGTATGPRAPQPPQPERALSSKTSAAISAGFKYTPPPPPKPADDEEADLRDIDKPKNEIVRLPKYTVTAKKPEIFTDRTLYTQEQLRKLAVSRYLTKLDTGLLNKWTIPGLGMSNEQRAMQMYLDDERLQNMSAVKEDISTLRATGSAERADQTQSDYYDMFLRRRDDIHSDTLTRQQGK